MEPPPTASGALPVRKHRQKRLKIDVACETCRAKKVKCDGVRPACGYCSRKLNLRDSCRYSNDDGALQRQVVRRSSDSLMRERVRRNTSPPSMHNAQLPGLDLTSLSPSPVAAVPPPPARAPPRPPSPGPPPDFQGSDLTIGTMTTTPSVIDSMTAVVDEGADTREFFGSSSAGSFTAQIKRAIDSRVGKPHAGAAAGPSSEPSRADGPLSSLSSGLDMPTDVPYVLPSRRQADFLVDLYWFYVDPLYPFLDKERWFRTYNAIFSGGGIETDERIFVATLNVILALASQLVESSTAEQRDESSARYFQRGQDLLPMNTWGTASVELVQCLLLTSQYLQSTNQPHQTWMVVGSVIRTAEGLGLHLPETSARLSSLADRELLRRLWYGCVLMDRMVSVTHGRPAMISKHIATDVPLPITSPLEADVMKILGNEVGHAAFLVKSVQLYEVTHRITIAFYVGKGCRNKCKDASSSFGQSDDGDEDLDAVVRLDRALNKWESGLPDEFKWSRVKHATSEVVRRQNIILRMRFLHARILLLRPVLSRFCLSYSPNDNHGSSSDTLHARVVEQAALLCVSTAQDIVSILAEHKSADGTVGLLPAWWYRVYYVYSAATILIATRLRPEAFAATDVARSWAQAMALLKAHEKFGNSARRCVAALHILSAKLLEAVPASTGGHTARDKRGVREGSEDATLAHVSDPGASYPDLHAGMPHLDTGPHAFMDEFAPPTADLGGLDLAEFDFDVNDLSWLNDMHAAWGFMNE